MGTETRLTKGSLCPWLWPAGVQGWDVRVSRALKNSGMVSIWEQADMGSNRDAWRDTDTHAEQSRNWDHCTQSSEVGKRKTGQWPPMLLP